MTVTTTLVIGASSAIAQALIAHYLERGDRNVVAISHSASAMKQWSNGNYTQLLTSTHP